MPSNRLENLLSRDADIAVRMVQPVQNDLITVKVNEMSMGAWAARTYLERAGRPRRMQDLFDHQIIGYDRETFMLEEISRMGIDVDRTFFAFRTDDQVAYWELVRAGAGIGFGANYLGRQSPELERLVPDLPIAPLPMWLTSHAELKTNRRIRIVMDFLRAALADIDL